MAGLFQEQANIYAAFRPTYPSALFDLLNSLTKRHERAWDVGTGNGQAAIALANYYDSVVATDVSDQQLRYAEKFKRSNITFARTSCNLTREEVTEFVGGEGSTDLITVAQAVHWFDLDSFYSHVKHVLRKPGGVVAVWCYTNPTVNPEVDGVLEDFYCTTLPYWEPALDMVNDGYKSLNFPFKPVKEEGTGPFRLDAKKEATVEGLLGFLKSWSAVNTARRKGVELVGEEVQEAFRNAWGNPDRVRTITFPLHLRIGAVV